MHCFKSCDLFFIEVQQAKHHGESTSSASQLSHKINKVLLLLQNLGFTQKCFIFPTVHGAGQEIMLFNCDTLTSLTPQNSTLPPALADKLINCLCTWSNTFEKGQDILKLIISPWFRCFETKNCQKIDFCSETKIFFCI